MQGTCCPKKRQMENDDLQRLEHSSHPRCEAFQRPLFIDSDNVIGLSFMISLLEMKKSSLNKRVTSYTQKALTMA